MKPSTTTHSDVFVPQRFKHLVARHIIKNNWKTGPSSALILGIHGPSGEGKTFQCNELFKEIGVTAVRIAARELESEEAGKPSKLVSAKYCEASDLLNDKRSHLSVLFMNDLDAGIGTWGADVQYTVNTQLVVATLMDIADFPTHVNGEETHRIPIIVTGNDFTKLYEPLTRAGRMDTYTWTPTFLEKVDIVRRSLFPMPSLTDDEIAGLVFAFRKMPVSFFSLVKGRLHDAYIDSLIRERGIAEVLKYVTEPNSAQYVPNYTFEVLFTIATAVASDKLINHLRRR